MRLVKVRVGAAVVAAILASGVITAWPYLRVASFVVRAVGLGGWLDAGARAMTVRTIASEARVPTRHGSVRVRLYRPSTAPARTVLLVSGAHPDGIDEPRLMRLAVEIAASGWAIATPELADLMAYQVTPASTDIIEDAGVWLAGQRDLAPDGRIGLIGVSFSGGLAIVAAGRPALRDRTRFVFSFGGHGDLPRVLTYLCTGIEPALNGALRSRPPHDYGLAFLTYWFAETIAPPEQVDRLRESVLTFLKASSLAVVDRQRAETAFERARELERSLPEPARTLMHYVNERNVTALGRRLLPYVGLYGTDPGLSPERSAPPRAPVFLLHGTDDNVIPAVESRLLGQWLEDRAPVRILLSNPISHVNVTQRPTVGDYWALIAFWRGLAAR